MRDDAQGRAVRGAAVVVGDRPRCGVVAVVVTESLEDLAKWDEALTQHTLLSPDEMRPALTPVELGGARPVWPANSDRTERSPVSYGFGWFLDPYRNFARMWHYGETMGFLTYIERFTGNTVGRSELTIIVLCNRTNLNPERFAAQIADLYIGSD